MAAALSDPSTSRIELGTPLPCTTLSCPVLPHCTCSGPFRHCHCQCHTVTIAQSVNTSIFILHLILTVKLRPPILISDCHRHCSTNLTISPTLHRWHHSILIIMPEYIAIQCFDCRTAQCIQKPKSGKFVCRLCNAKQSVRTVFAISFQAKDIRPVVQQINMKRGEREWEREQADREQAERWQQEDDEGEYGDENDYSASSYHASFTSATPSEAVYTNTVPAPAAVPAPKQSCWAGWTVSHSEGRQHSNMYPAT